MAPSPLPVLLALLGLAAPTHAASAPSDVELAGADAGAVRVPSAPGAWGGPRTGGEATLSDRVADYSIRAVLDPAQHTIEGRERLTWRNRSAVPVGSVYLHLYLNAFESDGSTYRSELKRFGAARTEVDTGKGEWGHTELRSVTQSGRPAPWAFVHPDGGPETDRTVVRVDLPLPVPPGGSTTLDIEFHDQLPRVVERTGWFDSFHLVGQWYPKIGVLELPGERGATRPRWNCHEFHLFSEFYADFGAYDLTVVAPEGYRVAASGVPVGAPEKGPDGVVHRFRAEDVHDVAFTAWNGFAPPLTATWNGPGSPPVTVEVLFPPEFRRGAEESLRATLDALEYFSRTLGPYPYRRVTVVVPPHNALEAGGMEYETFFTTASSNAFPGDAEGLERYVTAHEFGHGYFMGILASHEGEEPWLDEGLNEYWNSRMLAGQPFRLRLPAPLRWLGFQVPGLDVWDFERATAGVRQPADPVAASSWRRWSGGSYGLTYPRSAVVMHDLEAALGGDVLARGMRLYYERWRFRHPSTADLREALVDAGGDRAVVERWFEEQVHGAAPVNDRVVEVSAREVLPLAGVSFRDGKPEERDEEAVEKQVKEVRAAWEKEHGKPEDGKPGPFPWRSTVTARRHGAHLPQTLVVIFEDGAVERIAWPAGQGWGRWELVRPTKVRSAQLDPDRGILLDLDKLDDGRLRKAHRAPAARLALSAGGWMQFLLALVEAL
jgi:hypothetical protein